MLDGVSMDQLRTFIAAVDEGSFSAAGRRLRRAQSVVSKTLASLEGQLRVKLFDRSARRPVLTEQGRALLNGARTVAGEMDLFKAQAKGLAGGLEAGTLRSGRRHVSDRATHRCGRRLPAAVPQRLR
jgi:DNA-binding transcriptional LysR family regulator